MAPATFPSTPAPSTRHGRANAEPSARRTPSRRRSVLSLTLALSAVAALGACGSDDTKVNAAACDAAVAYGTAFAQAPQEPGAFGAYAKEKLVPVGEALERNLTGDAKEGATALRTAFAAVAESGDPSALEAPGAAAGRAAVGKAIHDGCDLQKVDVRAVEYMYIGAPAKLKPGRVSFAMKNEGVEDHEMVLFERSPDTAASLDELLELPEEEMGSKLMFTGVTFGSPKTTNYVAVDLEPGTYFLVCFLPQGGEHEGQHGEGQEGPPHFMGGMKQTIVVS